MQKSPWCVYVIFQSWSRREWCTFCCKYFKWWGPENQGIGKTGRMPGPPLPKSSFHLLAFCSRCQFRKSGVFLKIAPPLDFFVRSKVVFFFHHLWHHLNHGTWQNWRFVWSFNECLDIVLRSIFKLVQILCGLDKRWNGDFSFFFPNKLLNLTWCNGLNGHTFYELSSSTHQKSKWHNALLITCWGDV